MLVLPIKKKWFDMILSGEKKEEYREIKPYYTSRFSATFGSFEVMFRNGYSKKSPNFIAECSLKLGYGKPEWGAEPNIKYFVLTIENIKENKHEKNT